jgi:transposase
MKEEGSIILTASEQRRLTVLNQLEAGVLVNAEAAELLGLLVRQLHRLRGSYRTLGAAALSYGNRGRQPHNAVGDERSRKVVELATTKYAGFNQQHLTEMLAEAEGIHLSRPTVHRILTAAGILAPRRRRPPRHRRRCFMVTQFWAAESWPSLAINDRLSGRQRTYVNSYGCLRTTPRSFEDRGSVVHHCPSLSALARISWSGFRRCPPLSSIVR